MTGEIHTPKCFHTGWFGTFAINDDRLGPVGEQTLNPTFDLSSDTILITFVYQKAMTDFVENLDKIHHENANLLSFIEA